MDLGRTGEIAKTGAKPKLPTTIPNLTDTMLVFPHRLKENLVL